MKKLAVIFPGIGYTVDKPLMHYSRKLAACHGYEIKLLPYTGFPGKIIGNRERMKESYEIALRQAEEMLSDTDFSVYDEILFIGKSIGTTVAAQLAENFSAVERIRLILYTPLEDTFRFSFRDAVVFTGTADPWVGEKDSRIPELCRQRGIPCHIIEEANHSLETKDVGTDLKNMQKIMKKTERFMTDGT